MGNKRALLIVLLILCFSVVVFPNVGIVRAEGIIYIRADGTVEGTDQIQRDGNLYTFTDGIYGQIVIEKDGITVDGSQHVLHGMNEGGIFLENRSAVVLRNIKVVDAPFGITMLNGSNNIITGSNCSIKLDNSVNNTISGNERISLLFNNSSKNIVTGNNLSGNTYGFKLQSGSNENSIFGNNITDSTGGIEFHGYSNSNRIYENNIVDNEDGMMFHNSYSNSIYDNVIAYNRLAGVYLYSAESNKFFRNDFVDNGEWCQASSKFSSNFWDDGSTGNYWSDYNGTDADGDGIGDEPYLVPVYTLMGWDWEYDADNYPLMEPTIIPEFPSWIILPLLLTVILLVTLYRKRLTKPPIQQSY
jgi:parallel beta-helix repeat protein